MKAMALALIIILSLLASALVGCSLFKIAKANPITWAPPEFTILSPSQNGTYRSNVPLTINVTLFGNDYHIEQLTSLYYSLDGKSNVPIAFTYPYVFGSGTSILASDVLSGLKDGEHTLLIYGSTDWGNTFSSNVTFTADTSTPVSDGNAPRISIWSPENITYVAPKYSMNKLTLNFSVSKPFLWSRFSLDHHANETISANTTGIYLSELYDGPNSITVYAVDAAGNVGVSDTIEFNMIFLYSPYSGIPSPITPVVSVISPQNATYQANVPLIFEINNPVSLFGAKPIFPNVSWVGFSLDGRNNLTITGNTTLTGLSKGAHNITVYASDTYGNIGSSQNIVFITKTEPFPTVTIVAVSGISLAVVIIVGLMVYKKFKKYN